MQMLIHSINTYNTQTVETSVKIIEIQAKFEYKLFILKGYIPQNECTNLAH